MRVIFFLLVIVSLTGRGQALTSLNLNYWYDPNNEIEFAMSPVKMGDKMMIYYQLTSNRKENSTDIYSITWELRSNLSDRSGQELTGNDAVLNKSESQIQGVLITEKPTSVSVALAKVTNKENQTVFYFYKPFDPEWPVNISIAIDDKPWLQNYLPKGKKIIVNTKDDKTIYCFLYKKNFSPAQPPFSEAVRSDPFLKADSVFEIQHSFTPKTNGLYFMQEDTTSAQGLSFLAMDGGFPKYNSISALEPPLIYISTDEEYQNLLEAENDKASFDRIILDITRDRDRARNFMRSYFQRVEAANRYFSDYKEGWKTDRGMIYIIYGLPDEVSRTTTNEIWFYKEYKAKFIFNKSGSVFCPEIYKLQRDNSHMARWFALVDLWRKSRF
jgi:GWxTD domain-containing protein